jgi:lipopolysaccharide transport system permease protein
MSYVNGEAAVLSSPLNAPPAAVDDNDLPLTLIEPRRWHGLDLPELWSFRELLYFFTWRDVKVRYKQTVLGAAWAVLQPLTLAVVFTLVLAPPAASEAIPVPYPVFVYSGLILWGLFASGLGSAANSLIESERLVSKIYFPRLIIPLAALGPAVVDFLVAGVVLIGMLLYYQVPLATTAVFAPLAVAVLLMTLVGVGSLLSALNVAYRDFRYTTTFMLQAWMFATPAIYLASFAQPLKENRLTAQPGAWSTWFVYANPLNGCIAFFRAALLGLPLPWPLLAVSAVVAIALLVLGFAYFQKAEDTFADVI